jgi:mannitol/fructose-specific phosphotransferase system IIA component (Ntr-type)
MYEQIIVSLSGVPSDSLWCGKGVKMLLNEVFDKEHIKLNLESSTKYEAFWELIDTISLFCPQLDRKEMYEAVAAREKQLNTAIMPGIAVPHGYCRTLSGIVGAIGISRTGIAYDENGGKPVHCIFMILMGEADREKHLRILSRLLNLIQSQDISKIQSAKNVQEIRDILCRF